MWILAIENPGRVKGVFKQKIPSLKDIKIHDLSIIIGEDMELILKFDINEMPEEIPPKWHLEKVNSIQFIFNFIGVSFTQMNINRKISNNTTLDIKSCHDGNKQIRIYDNEGDVIMSFLTKWIYVQNITGYHNNIQ